MCVDTITVPLPLRRWVCCPLARSAGGLSFEFGSMPPISVGVEVVTVIAPLPDALGEWNASVGRGDTCATVETIVPLSVLRWVIFWCDRALAAAVTKARALAYDGCVGASADGAGILTSTTADEPASAVVVDDSNDSIVSGSLAGVGWPGNRSLGTSSALSSWDRACTSINSTTELKSSALEEIGLAPA